MYRKPRTFAVQNGPGNLEDHQRRRRPRSSCLPIVGGPLRTPPCEVHDQGPAHQFRQIAQAALRHRVPSNYAICEYAKAGGLLSYDADLIDNFRRAATYVDKILRPSGGGPLVD